MMIMRDVSDRGGIHMTTATLLNLQKTRNRFASRTFMREVMSMVGVRWLVIAVLALLLTGCEDDPKRKTQEATVRFKSIITLTVDGQPREFSNVMQVYYRGIGKSLLGYATRSKSWGEAIVIDLGERGRAYVLPMNFSRTNNFGNVYPSALLQTFGINTSMGG